MTWDVAVRFATAVPVSPTIPLSGVARSSGARALSATVSQTIALSGVSRASPSRVKSASVSLAIALAGTARSTPSRATSATPTFYLAMTAGYHAFSFATTDDSGNPITMNAQVFIRNGYDPSTPEVGMLSMHGSGERGTNNSSQLGVGLGPFVTANASTFGACVVFPQLPVTAGSSQAVLDYLYRIHRGALDWLCANVNINPHAVLVQGNSAGALRTYGVLQMQPTRFAGALSCEGGVFGKEIAHDADAGTPTTDAQGAVLFAAISGLPPIHMVNNANDGTVSPTYLYNLSAAFGNTDTFPQPGGFSHYTHTDGVLFADLHETGGHSWDPVYNDGVTLNALLALRR